MTNAPVYVLDANVFIEAANRYYAFDLETRFWDLLVESAANDRLRSVDWVKRELVGVNDELARWADGPFSFAFASTDEESVIDAYREVMVWADAQDQFLSEAKAAFADGADGWLVAYAKAKACIVVTHEVLSPDARRRVPIPNVCRAFELTCVNTFGMLRGLGLRLS